MRKLLLALLMFLPVPIGASTVRFDGSAMWNTMTESNPSETFVFSFLWDTAVRNVINGTMTFQSTGPIGGFFYLPSEVPLGTWPILNWISQDVPTNQIQLNTSEYKQMWIRFPVDTAMDLGTPYLMNYACEDWLAQGCLGSDDALLFPQTRDVSIAPYYGQSSVPESPAAVLMLLGMSGIILCRKKLWNYTSTNGKHAAPPS